MRRLLPSKKSQEYSFWHRSSVVANSSPLFRCIVCYPDQTHFFIRKIRIAQSSENTELSTRKTASSTRHNLYSLVWTTKCTKCVVHICIWLKLFICIYNWQHVYASSARQFVKHCSVCVCAVCMYWTKRLRFVRLRSKQLHIQIQNEENETQICA